MVVVVETTMFRPEETKGKHEHRRTARLLAEKRRVQTLLESMPLPAELVRMHATPQGDEAAQCERDAYVVAAEPRAGQTLPESVEARQHKFVVGLGHIVGYAVSIDHAFGLVCLREAAESGCVPAQAAMCLDDEDVLVRDRAFSVLLGVSNSDEGYSDAVCFACKCLCAKACEMGLVATPEHYSVVKEYETAMLEGFSMGNFLCGCMYMRQQCGALAYMLFKEAARQGVVLAHVMLALCLSQGLGVPEDASEALKHARYAHKRGSRRGTFLYASLLLENEVVDEEQQQNNEAHAFTLLLRLADQYNASCKEETYMRCTYLNGARTCPNPHRRLYECYRDGVGTIADSGMAALHESKTG